MSLALALDTLTDETISLLQKVCSIRPNKTQYNDDPQLIDCFAVNEDENAVYVPIGTWRTFLDEFPTYVYPPITAVCKDDLYTLETDPKGFRDQDQVAAEALDILESSHSVFIAASPGFGKTKTGNWLGCALGLKILVVCHLDIVNNQWVEEFENHSTAKVQHVKGNKPLDPTADVYVIGILKMANMSRSDFSDIGTVIFDEAHIATKTAFTQSLLKVCPRYLIGLSATPERFDGLHKLFKVYFGPKSGYITRQEIKSFTVYKYETDYQPTTNYRLVKGQMTIDWTGLINSLAYNEDRHQTIVDIILQHPEERVFVLSDRKAECRAIYDRLLAINPLPGEVYLMTDGVSKKAAAAAAKVTKVKKCTKAGKAIKAKKVKPDINKIIQSHRILIAGKKKAGVGFNDPTRTMLVICTDIKDIRQYEGRIRTSDNIVYDIVDSYKSLENHWEKRAEWYEKRGATIVKIPRKTLTVASSKVVPFRRRLPKNH